MNKASKKRVVVTGSNGQLGTELITLTKQASHFDFTFLSRDTFPLDDQHTMQYWLDNNPVDILINCAAYTAVDKAESEKDKAFEINAKAPGFLAAQLAKKKARLIQISTDYVFDGNSSQPLSETAATDPVNTYGSSKLQGEILALHNNADTQIIRTSWLYSAYGNNFVKTMIRLMKDRSSIKVVQDQKGSPTYAGDLAGALLVLLDADRFVPGIYHYSNEGETTWFDFAVEIKNLINSRCEVLAIPSSEFPTAAKRPAYSLMDKSKIKSIYGLNIPDWKTSLAHCIEIIKNQ